MQQELIEMLEEITQYVEVWNAHDQGIIDKAEALVEKAKNSAKEPAVPDTHISVQEAWEAAGGNPGIKASKADLIIALKTLDTVCDEADAAPAVPQGIPAHEVIDAIEAWKSAWAKVPPFGNKVNKATREAITFSHNTLFQLLWSAQQAQRMPKACPTPTGCGPHGCHEACITVTTPAPSQPVTLTDGLIEKGAMTGMVDAQIDSIIAALREKQGGV